MKLLVWLLFLLLFSSFCFAGVIEQVTGFDTGVVWVEPSFSGLLVEYELPYEIDDIVIVLDKNDNGGFNNHLLLNFSLSIVDFNGSISNTSHIHLFSTDTVLRLYNYSFLMLNRSDNNHYYGIMPSVVDENSEKSWWDLILEWVVGSDFEASYFIYFDDLLVNDVFLVSLDIELNDMVSSQFLLKWGTNSTTYNFTYQTGHLQNNSVNGVFVYDLNLDSLDYTTWFNDSTASWWLEANVTNCTSLGWNYTNSPNDASSAVRGCKREFPIKSYLIVSDGGLDIIDADTSRLWKRNVTSPLGQVYAEEGKIYLDDGSNFLNWSFKDDIYTGLLSRRDNLYVGSNAFFWSNSSGFCKTGGGMDWGFSCDNYTRFANVESVVGNSDEVFVGSSFEGVSVFDGNYFNYSRRYTTGSYIQSLWNKMDGNDTAYYDFSEVGLNLTYWTTPGDVQTVAQDYVSGKFGNSVEIHNDLSSSGTFISLRNVDGSVFGRNRHTIEFWIKLPYNVTDGIRDKDNAVDGNSQVIWNCWRDSNNRVAMDFIDKDDVCPNCGLRILHRVNGGSSNFFIGNKSAFDMAEDTWHHWAMVYDRNGIGGTSDRKHFYFDGVLIASDINYPPFQNNDYTTCGATWNPVTTDRSNQMMNDTYMDNLKMYTFAKTNFEDGVWEDGNNVSVLLGSNNNVTSLALQGNNGLWVGLNDGGDGGGVSGVKVNNDSLFKNYTSPVGGLGSYDVSSLYWRANTLLIGTFDVGAYAVEEILNTAPVFVLNISNVSFVEDGYNDSLDLDFHFSDGEGNIVGWDYEVSDGNISVDIDNVTGIVNFTSVLNWFGFGFVNFTAVDVEGLISNVSNNVLVNVTPLNDAPIINLPNVFMNASANFTFSLVPYTVDVDNLAAELSWFVFSENVAEVDCNITDGSNITLFAKVFGGQASCGVNVTDGVLWGSDIMLINVTGPPGFVWNVSDRGIEWICVEW